MKLHNLIKLIVSLLICQLAGGLGSIFTSQSVNSWYLTLNKPAITPPGSFIGLVWTILFLLMGYALFIIWIKINKKEGKKAILFFSIQLVLNIGWSFCFFYLQNPLAGLVEIIFLWLAILVTIIYFYK
ncbi:MAG: TspO protein, partial [Candidatus Buchananbacteria bacterium RBG_13_36_9]